MARCTFKGISWGNSLWCARTSWSFGAAVRCGNGTTLARSEGENIGERERLCNPQPRATESVLREIWLNCPQAVGETGRGQLDDKVRLLGLLGWTEGGNFFAARNISIRRSGLSLAASFLAASWDVHHRNTAFQNRSKAKTSQAELEGIKGCTPAGWPAS